MAGGDRLTCGGVRDLRMAGGDCWPTGGVRDPQMAVDDCLPCGVRDLRMAGGDWLTGGGVRDLRMPVDDCLTCGGTNDCCASCCGCLAPAEGFREALRVRGLIDPLRGCSRVVGSRASAQSRLGN